MKSLRTLTSLFLIAFVIMAGTWAGAKNPNDKPPELGPHVVILDELEDVYEPVPFDHLSHAKMAEMWNGCETCHHHSPDPTDIVSTATLTHGSKNQEDAAEIPACKSCHSIDPDDSDIHMPALKGAYHRQCLNCHQEWMHQNACVICHEPKEGRDVSQMMPSTGDIVGRMHPPIPEPDQVTYKTRFTPADGGNVLFRHKEHTTEFGIRCVDCHHRDSCAHCHSPEGDVKAKMPLEPGMTWEESHGPCMACHQGDRCHECHYHDRESPPDPFEHGMTGQLLDVDHAGLACGECHADLTFINSPTCGDNSCHDNKTIAYPKHLPGELLEEYIETIAADGVTIKAAVPAGGGAQ